MALATLTKNISYTNNLVPCAVIAPLTDYTNNLFYQELQTIELRELRRNDTSFILKSILNKPYLKHVVKSVGVFLRKISVPN